MLPPCHGSINAHVKASQLSNGETSRKHDLVLFVGGTGFTVVWRLHSVAHVVHFAILQLPGFAFQDPDVFASVEHTVCFLDVIQGMFNPARPGDAVILSAGIPGVWQQQKAY